MKRLILCLAFALSLLPATARAQVEMSIQIGLPVAPPMVVVQPGIQVVENQDEEVFFVGGWYWCRRGDYWYRARSPRASFAYVEPQRVPYRLAYLPPPGHYRHWRREQLREERHWWKEHDRDRRRAWKEHEQAERHGWRAEGDHGRGPSHGPPSRGGPAPAPAPGHGGHGDRGHGDRGHGHDGHDR